MASLVISKMTKELFAESLKKYMKKKPINKITIQEIAQDCGLNRRTFYRHFKDIYDLLEWIFQTEVENKINQYLDFSHWHSIFLDLFEYFYYNKEICYCVIKYSNREHLEIFLYDLIIKLVKPVMEQEFYNVELSQKRRDFLSNFYALSFTAIFIQWMGNGNKEDPKEIVDNISLILKGSIERIEDSV